MVIRNDNNKIENLRSLYAIIAKTITNKDCYYTQEEIDKLKQDNKHIFIKGGGNNEY